MNFLKIAATIGLSLLILGPKAFANDPVVRIPLKTFTKPPFDLIDEKGKRLSTADLARLNSQGVDLSKLNPIENKYWQNKKFAAVDPKLAAEMPNTKDEVIFDDYLGANRELGIFSIYIKPKNDTQKRYGLTFGLQIHSSLTKAALLRKLGIYQESPKYLNQIKVRFESKEKMQEFIERAFCEKGPGESNADCLSLDPTERGFVTDVNETEKSLILHGGYLEKMDAEVPGLFDGLTPASYESLPYFNQSRAFRALVVPFVVGDIGESINRFSPISTEIRGGWAYMNFINAVFFDDYTSHDDVKWMLRRMAALNEKDWDEIVDAGAFPKQVQPLVRAVLIHRMKNMVESFFSKEEQNEILQVKIPSLDINSGDGVVVHGKVMTEKIEGYPQRFSHGDRQSPFESADLVKYGKIRLHSGVIQVALDKLTEDLHVSRQLSRNIEGLEFTPNGVRPIGSASGVNAGLNFNAVRLITTGTYYGSQAPVQLVDNVRVSGALGYNKVLLAAGGITKNVGANVAYTRDYTHVTPLDSIKQTDKIPWKDLLVPSKLRKSSSPLKDGKLTEFLNDLKVGEVFTITDSIEVMGRAGVGAALDTLMGFASKYSPSIGVSVDGSSIILRQVQFIKTQDGLQIFVRDQSPSIKDKNLMGESYKLSHAYGIQFDFNYFINLMSVRWQKRITDLKTDAFLIDYNAQLMADVDNGKITPDGDVKKEVDQNNALSKKAAAAIRALFFQSSKGPLYSNFRGQQFEIDHYLKTKELQSRIFWFRATQMDEEHLLTMMKSEVKAPEGSTVVNKPIQVVTNAKGELTGKDFLGFGLAITDGLLNEKFPGQAPTLSQPTQNPSQMPFGRAQWRLVRTDSELSQDRVGALPSVSVLERVWGGWNIKKADLDSILVQVKENMKGTKFADYLLIPDGALRHVEKVDFFRVTSHLSLLPGALDKVKDLVLAPEAANDKVDKHRFVSRLFQKLSEIGGKARPQDKAVYNNLMRLLGNGDENQGRQAYLYQCQVNRENQVTYSWMNGTGYECLEPWVEKIIKLSRNYPQNDLRAQNRWMTQVLFVLDQYIPQSFLMNELGEKNFLYFVEVTGFRKGDEDGDDGSWVSNVLGEPAKKSEYANGLISVFAQRSRIVPVELNRTQGSFQ